MFIPPRRIALSGGGMKGIAHIGALEVLEQAGHLKHVRTYYGISSGAFCAFCIAIGCSLPELSLLVTSLDLGFMRNLDPELMFQFTETFGFDDGSNVEKLLKAILKGKGLDTGLTFEGLSAIAAERGLPALVIYATDLNTCSTIEFSALTTPNTELVLALRASMCIPIYFTPVRDPATGHYYIDGGVITHFPFELLKSEQREETLGFSFSYEHKQTESIESLPEFLKQLYHTFDFQRLLVLKEEWPRHIVNLPCGHFPSIHFEAGPQEKLELIEAGRAGMRSFLAAQKGRAPPRRFSVA